MLSCRFFFFFNDTATTEIYTLSLHDALPIYPDQALAEAAKAVVDWEGGTKIGASLDLFVRKWGRRGICRGAIVRSEEHTSELQSQSNLVCRLLLEKKKKITSRRRWVRKEVRG